MTSLTHMSPAAEAIFVSAMDLFRENGYSNTNVRQIAERANLSLGLLNHHFESKRNLGYLVLRTLIGYVSAQTDEYLKDASDDLLLLDAVATRAVNDYLKQGPFRQFYLDTLEEDIFFHYLENLTICILERLQDAYGYTISHDIALLYGRYVPNMVEKALVLKKGDHLFSSVAEDDIAYYIFSSTYARYIPEDALLKADSQARQIVPHILEKLSPIPSMELLKNLERSDEA